jgi:nucleotide-binding universal stress UspA family protein
MTTLRPRIILATDLSARCDRAFDRAVFLARAWSAHLTVAHALEAEPAGRGLNLRWRGGEQERRQAEAQIRADLEAAGAAADVVIAPRPAPMLIAALAKRSPCNLIVAGISRGADLARPLRESTLEAVARRSGAPVLSVARPARGAYRSAVVGTNFSEGSRAALQATLGLFPAAEVATLHAYRRHRESMAGGQEPDAAYQHLLGECTRFVIEAAPRQWRRIRRLAEVGYAETLLKEYSLERGIDLISVGLEARHPFLTFLLGGTIAPLLRLSSCSDVLIVPAHWTPSPGHEQLSFADALSGAQPSGRLSPMRSRERHRPAGTLSP